MEGGAAGGWASQGPSLPWWRRESAAIAKPADGGSATARLLAHDSRAAFWGVMAFTFVLLISPQSYVPALGPLRLAFLSVLGSAAALLGYRWSHGRPLVLVTREMWIAVALGGWAVVTIPWSYWPGGSVSFLLNIYAKSVAVLWLLANTVTTPRRVRRLVWALTLMGVPLALAGVRHFFSGEFVRGDSGRIVGYMGALTQNPNDLALMLNLLLPLAVALALSDERPVVRLALMAVIALDVAAVVATFSRAGFLTLGTLLCVYLWKFRARPERRVTWGLVTGLVVVILIGIPLLPASYLERLGTITNINADKTGSAEARWADSGVALQLISRHPVVGAGLGQNMLALNQERGKRWTEVHNVYLQYAVDLGLPGLLLFVILLGLSLRSTALVQRESEGRPAFRDLFCLAEGAHVSLIAFVVAGMFHPVAYHFYFYYMAGLAIGIRETWREHRGAAGGATDPSAAVGR